MSNNEIGNVFQLHALSCCLKSVCTSDAAFSIEQLRLACGGHGYCDASNLPATYGMITAMCTYEGENTVMLLQTARYLVKAWKQAVNGDLLPPTVKYLEGQAKKIKQRPWKNTLTCIVRGHEAVAAGLISNYNLLSSIFMFLTLQEPDGQICLILKFKLQ